MNGRPIEFRMWDKVTKSMLEVSMLMLPVADKFEVFQYTGFIDAHGAKIFEGHIVSHPDGVGVVEWGLCGWQVSNGYSQGFHRMTVIGNVFENENLLNEKANSR